MKDLKNLKGKDVNAGTEQWEGGTTLTGGGIAFYRLLTIRQALMMHPMKLSSSPPAATTLARRELGIKGNKESLIKQVDAIIERIQAERALDE